MTGKYNICAGPGAGASLTTGSHNILIGPDAGKDFTTESGQVVITDWDLAYRLLSLGAEALASMSDEAKAIAADREAHRIENERMNAGIFPYYKRHFFREPT